ncbi:transposase TnpA for transposon Tn5393 [Agrobacterium sp. ATCC 31749]|nr:transposase TnpA for transposon Tn5393 [Agrobacterium sp. ATCC 31749]
MEAELHSDKINDLCRYQFTRSQYPAGIAEDAQLQGEAESVVSAPALPDVAEILIAKSIVLQQIRLRGRQAQQRIPLPIS